MKKNLIVTGIPRAGTTLTAALIDRLPDTVCLNEPDWQTGPSFGSPADYAAWLVEDFARLRSRLLAGRPVADRRAEDGKALTNYFARGADGKMIKKYETVAFTRPGLTPGFTLAVKHNGPYLAILPAILDAGGFDVLAVVRHPVEAIHSWRSLELPISRGALPNAAPYWPRLAALIAQPIDLLEKQVKIYELMCRRLYRLRERIALLAYEELVQNPALLSERLGIDAAPDGSLIASAGKSVPAEERRQIIGALKTHGHYYRYFYPAL